MKFLIVAIISLLAFSFGEPSFAQASAHFKGIQSASVTIKSPYNCYETFEFGHGDTVRYHAFSKRSSNERSRADTLIGSSTFIIKRGVDLNRLKKIFAQIRSKATVRTTFSHDVFGFEVRIDNTTYIDTYKYDKEVYRILDIIHKYFKNSREICSFFSVFKK